MDDQTKRRFQFSLRELLAIVVLAGLGLLVVGPFIMRRFAAVQYYWPPRAEYSNERCFAPALLVVGVSCVGALAGLRCAHRFGFVRWQRGACLVAGTLVAWFGLLVTADASKYSANHAAVAAACKAFAEAEEIFHRIHVMSDKDQDYSPSLAGLVETKPGANDLLLVDHSFAAAEVVDGHASAWCGYVFKVLKAEGPVGGRGIQRSYVCVSAGQEHMMLGYAFVACPAVYGESGRDLFIISNSGTIFHRDAGEKTREVFEQMTEFNPDPKEGWVEWK